MRRRVVLHLLAGSEVVFAGASRRAAQVGLPDPPGQGAVRHVQTVVRQQFAHPDHVAAGACEGGFQSAQCGLVARRRFGGAVGLASRRMRRTVLRDRASRRLISRRLCPCACRVRTAVRISVGVMRVLPLKRDCQGVDRRPQARRGRDQRRR